MNDLDLFNACMNYCRIFTNVIAHQNQLQIARLNFDGMNEEILAQKVKIEKKWLKDEYNHLCEVIEKLRE